jgi:hypothetical protein
MNETLLTLTDRDRAVLACATGPTRLFSLEQAAATWWSGFASGIVAARARLARLETAGLLVKRVFPTHPLLALDAPLVVWRPGDDLPDFGSISYRLQKRWNLGTVPTTTYIATTLATKLMGGLRRGDKADGRLRHPLQATHDLHVAELYLRFLRSEPALAECWVSEEVLQKRNPGKKASDGALLDRAGEIRLAIEFGGSYRSRRVKSFHRECARKNLPYELW